MANHMTINNFTVDQHTAVELCCDLTTRIASVTGEAGTGKTAVIGAVCEALEAMGIPFMLCAPTGRAAARIREATGRRAQTIHRLLGYGPPDPTDPEDSSFPSRGKTNPVPASVILVDEASMMSEDLYRNLIDSLRKNACIRFFGDINQLPPVNATIPPFKRLLEKFPKVILTKNFRSTDGIVQAAQTILRGGIPRVNSRFNLIKIQNQMGLSVLDKFITDELLDPKAAQIITPTRVGKLGTIIVNNYVQERVNPTGKTLKLKYTLDGGVEYLLNLRPGDKILWSKNDYNLGLMNGMIGRVIRIDDFEGEVHCEFEGRDIIIPTELTGYDENRKREFTYDPRKYIELAYAITTHKSQGSEFGKVIILLYFSSVLTRQNFYTAVTRGKQHVTVIAGPGGLKSALRNDPVMENEE